MKRNVWNAVAAIWLAVGGIDQPVLAQVTISWGTVTGTIIDASGIPIEGTQISIEGATAYTQSSGDGSFSLPRVSPGTHVLRFTKSGYATRTMEVLVRPGAATEARVELSNVFELEELAVSADLLPGATSTAPDLLNTMVLAGTSNTILRLDGLAANLAEKSPRQLFARVPGVFAYDMDGSGNQVNISTRGLDAHRSWELNVRQDGVLLNSDLYGYPASHYSPPMEAIEQIEMIRGTAALQYGSQYGGLVNYVTKGPKTDRAIGFESSSSVGSFGLVSTYNAAGGRIGDLTYYGYFSERKSDGYRSNSSSDYAAQYLAATLQLSPSTTLRSQIGRSAYTYQIPGPLNDAQFSSDPRQATRSRNFYSPDITVPALRLEWRDDSGAELTTTLSGVFGPRESVQFIGFSDTPDAINPITNEYAPRQVDIDHFRSISMETRYLRPWTMNGIEHTASAGAAFARNHMTRRQRGVGTTGTDFDLNVTSLGFPRDVAYRTVNGAVYFENLFRFRPRWTVTPGLRLEVGRTRMEGDLAYYDPADVGREIEHRYPLFGIRSSYQVEAGPELYAGWSQAYRPQILKDVLPGNALERTDPNLSDSRGWTLEAGIRGTLGQRLGYDMSVFQMRIRDRFGTVLSSDSGGSSFLLRTNVGTSRTRGAEISLEAWIAQERNFALWVHTATSFYHGRYVSGTVVSGDQNIDIAGNTLESVPKWMSRSGVSMEVGRASANLLLSYVDKSFSDPVNTIIPSPNGAVGLVPAHTLVDLNMGFEGTEWLRIRAGINNLFDRRYFTKRPQFYPGPGVWPSDGRSFQLSADLSFWR